ncbi:MAG: hypothetical protein LBD80_07815 [Tannerella sp.]|nr:hypothetical protein [Tannerella sp.]
MVECKFDFSWYEEEKESICCESAVARLRTCSRSAAKSQQTGNPNGQTRPKEDIWERSWGNLYAYYPSNVGGWISRSIESIRGVIKKTDCEASSPSIILRCNYSFLC